MDEFIAPKFMRVVWPMAQRFWNAYQVYDPAGIMEFAAPTARSAKVFADRLADLRDATPPNLGAYGEKVQIAACIGLSHAEYTSTRLGIWSAADKGPVRELLFKLLKAPASLFEIDPSNGAPLGSRIAHVSGWTVRGVPADGVRVLIEALNKPWTEALVRDCRVLRPH